MPERTEDVSSNHHIPQVSDEVEQRLQFEAGLED